MKRNASQMLPAADMHQQGRQRKHKPVNRLVRLGSADKIEAQACGEVGRENEEDLWHLSKTEKYERQRKRQRRREAKKRKVRGK